MRRARGQSLIITVMIMLVVVLMVFFTFSVGERTRKKMRMQALADSTAYSTAVAEARAMNFYALSNRAIISNMVSVLSVSAHNTWMTWYEDMLLGTANNWWNMASALHDRGRNDPACGPCVARLDNAARAAFDIAEWYAFAMPTINGQTAHAGGINLPGLPEPWSPWTHPTPGMVWKLGGGGMPVRVPYDSWSVQVDRLDVGCYNLMTPKIARSRNTSGLGDRGDCEARLRAVRGPRGGYWMHRQFHGKVDGDWCSLMNAGRRQHFDAAQLARAQQFNVERELVMLLRGALPADPHILRNRLKMEDVRKWLFEADDVHIDTDPSYRDGTESASGGAIDFYDAKNQTGGTVAMRPLAETLARKSDPEVSVTDESLKLTSRLYMDAIVPQYAPGVTPRSDPVDPARAMSHRDFDQMEFTARYPQWVFQRKVNGYSDHLLREENWRQLELGARRIAAAAVGGQVTNYAWYFGNTKAMSVRELPGFAVAPSIRPLSAGMDAYVPVRNEIVNEQVWWLQRAAIPPADTDPVYVDNVTGTWVNSFFTWNSVQGKTLVDEMEDETLMKVFGRNFGHGSSDFGSVYSELVVGGACGTCGRVDQTTDQAKGRNANWNRGDGEAPKGIHFFHGEAPHLGHRQGSVNQSTDHSYVGHMRFAATDQPDDLWGSPRTLVMLTRPVLDANVRMLGQQGRRPWDFDFSTQIFGKMKFKTIRTAGDALSADEMAAAASGLVYYHQPTRWDEPPNLWNPFWRAKLHPMRRDQLLQAGHAPTTRAVSALPPTAINE